MKPILHLFYLIPDDFKCYVIPADHVIVPHLAILHGRTQNLDDFTDEQDASSEFLYKWNGEGGEGNALKEFEISPDQINQQSYSAIYIFSFYQ